MYGKIVAWENEMCLQKRFLFPPYVFNSREGGGDNWDIFYTSSQSFITKFSYSLALPPWGLHLVERPNVLTTNCNLQKM